MMAIIGELVIDRFTSWFRAKVKSFVAVVVLLTMSFLYVFNNSPQPLVGSIEFSIIYLRLFRRT
jgi:hypothetical protein